MALREVYGCAKLWQRAGAEVRNFSVWPLGPQPAKRGVFGHNKGVACGARGTVTKTAHPMVPTVPRAPWASPPAIPVAGSGLALFLAKYLCLKLTDWPEGPKQWFSTLRADQGKYRAGKVRFRGPKLTLWTAPYPVWSRAILFLGPPF